MFKRKYENEKKTKDFTFGCSYGMNRGTHKISIQNKVSGFQLNGFGITTDIEYFGLSCGI